MFCMSEAYMVLVTSTPSEPKTNRMPDDVRDMIFKSLYSISAGERFALNRMHTTIENSLLDCRQFVFDSRLWSNIEWWNGEQDVHNRSDLTDFWKPQTDQHQVVSDFKTAMFNLISECVDLILQSSMRRCES